jgi:predicted membrane protein
MLALIIIPLIICIAFILLAVFVQDHYDIWATVLATLFGVIAIFIFLFAVVKPLEIKEEIKQFKAFEHTLINARENSTLSAVERAAILSKIAEWNEWLADVQYRNTWLINAVPDDVNDLKPIK